MFTAGDEYDLARFLRAQEPVYGTVTGSLRRGRMITACMDFIFPSLIPSNPSARCSLFGIGSLDEARAYLSEPVLGGRYRECVLRLQRLVHLDARTVCGDRGAKQLHASLTLFSAASDEFLLETMFDVWFDGLVDEATLGRLRAVPQADRKRDEDASIIGIGPCPLKPARRVWRC